MGRVRRARIDSGRGGLVDRFLRVLGVERETMCVYAKSLDDVRPSASAASRSNACTPPGVTVDAERVTEASTPPRASWERVESSDFVAVATDDRGSVVGWTLLRVETPVVVEERGVTVRFEGAYVWGLFVDPEARRRGIGTALVQAATSFAAADRVRSVYVLVDANNERSRRLFEGVGFEQVDAVARYRLRVLGRYLRSFGAKRSYADAPDEAHQPPE